MNLKKHYAIGWITLLLSLIILPTIIFMTIKTKINADANVSQAEMIVNLMNKISTLDSRFSAEISWIIGIISLIGIVVGFYSYQQFKLSSDSIQKIEAQISSDFEIIRSIDY